MDWIALREIKFLLHLQYKKTVSNSTIIWGFSIYIIEALAVLILLTFLYTDFIFVKLN